MPPFNSPTPHPPTEGVTIIPTRFYLYSPKELDWVLAHSEEDVITMLEKRHGGTIDRGKLVFLTRETYDLMVDYAQELYYEGYSLGGADTDHAHNMNASWE